MSVVDRVERATVYSSFYHNDGSPSTYCLLVDEFRHNAQSLLHCLVEVVVYHNVVELGGLRQLECGTLNALLNHLGSVGGASCETAAQFLYRGRLNEYAESAVAVELLDVASTLDVYVEHHVLAACSLSLHLLLQGAVEAVLIHLLIFKELVARYALAKLLWSDEEILYTVLLGAARCTK